jgi:hypothetical protein
MTSLYSLKSSAWKFHRIPYELRQIDFSFAVEFDDVLHW